MSDECNHNAHSEVCEYESPYNTLSETYEEMVSSSLSITYYPNEDQPITQHKNTEVVATTPNGGKLIKLVNILR